MSMPGKLWMLFGGIVFLLGSLPALRGTPASADDAAARGLDELAKKKQAIHRFSTLFTAQDVRDRLATEEGVKAAVRWCQETGLTKAALESFRDGSRAPRELLPRTRDRFRAEGFAVSGCVTTTGIGKRSNGWKPLSCYTDRRTQDQVQEIFATTAGLFDE